jgi:hypothetical protein
MRRRLLNLAAAASLGLCVAAAVLWVRSYRTGDGFVWKPTDADRTYYRAYVGRGGARLGRGAYPFDHAGYFEYSPDESPARPSGYHPGGLADRLGFDYQSGSDAQGMPSADLFSPLWAVVAGAGLFPAWRARSLYARRRCRLMIGRCASCGYDLRATPDRCPECGKASAR